MQLKPFGLKESQRKKKQPRLATKPVAAKMTEKKEKGGKRRTSVPVVCGQALRKIMKERHQQMKEAIFDSGIYNHVSKTTQPHPAGLRQNKKLLESLVETSNGEIRPSQPQVAIAEYPSCNDTNYKVAFWSMSKATAMATLLAHGRRIRYEPQRLQATKVEAQIIQKLALLEPGLQMLQGLKQSLAKGP